ncbi:hypothetical protein L798_14012 [Zootermopsis nevadensis]|uniref:Uncharacterized protein n=1 Tax=Zootermopsis nevadensis TaxID=136037 RepID=A0A067QQG9_ZOONE|nr:hypothetical protein L798_14012 [Zootermopsis nevadensis]
MCSLALDLSCRAHYPRCLQREEFSVLLLNHRILKSSDLLISVIKSLGMFAPDVEQRNFLVSR